MNKQILVVFGATGQQGGSVITHVLNDSTLSQKYTIRAVTRDLTKPGAKALSAKGIKTIQGDINDPSTLGPIMQDAHTVFGVTTTIYESHGKDREVTQGRAIADAAVAAGVKYFIWSTVPHISRISKGKYTHGDIFDSKAEVEEYIRTLVPMKSAFFSPGSFMQNYTRHMKPNPTVDDGESFALSNIVSPQTKIPLVEIAADTGKFVGAILAEPEMYEGKTFCAASQIVTFEEIARMMGQVTGKKVTYNQVPESVYRQFLPSGAADTLVDMMLYIQDFGYYGAETGELVEWAGEHASGKLTTFEEYLRSTGFSL